MNIYEMYGRLAEGKTQMDDFTRRTLELLRAIKAGEIAPDDVELTDNGWRVRPLSD